MQESLNSSYNERVLQARSINLLDYLQAHEPSNLKHVRGNQYELFDHDSLKITAPSGKWFWFSRGFGGHTALDFLIKVRDIPFTQALSMLSDNTVFPCYVVSSPKPLIGDNAIPFCLPEAAKYPNQVVRYLQERGIHSKLIRYALEKGLLYQSKAYGNCVFVGKDEQGKARFAACRGTQSDFKCDVKSSDKAYSFFIPAVNPQSKHLLVFESPIDALSHATLQHKKGFPWDGYRLSLGGVSEKALLSFLKRYPQIRTITLHLDNDKPGLFAARKIQKILNEHPQYEKCKVKIRPPHWGKDYNQDLQTRIKQERQKNIERGTHHENQKSEKCNLRN